MPLTPGPDSATQGRLHGVMRVTGNQHNVRWGQDPDGANLSCLFVVNGLGMGNSTRCYAVIQRLFRAGVTIHVATSGNGLKFFENRPEVTSLIPVDSFFYSVGRHQQLSVLGTALSLPTLLRRAARKTAQLEAACESIRPAFCVVDSEYTTRPLRRRKTPVIALNNSDVVVSEYLGRSRKPRNTACQFWSVEFMDYLFHRLYVDMTISPAAKPLPPRHAKIRRVGVIVRREIEERAPTTPPAPLVRPRDVRTLTFMLSGSILGRIGNIQFDTLPCQVDVIGLDGPSTAQVRFHGKITNNADLLAQSDLLVVNGGFSAVSEALALRKPTLVIPVPRHAEQYVNACQVADLGLGYLTDEHEVTPLLQRLFRTNEWAGLPAKPVAVDFDGAAQAAGFIHEFLQQRGIARGTCAARLAEASR
jgi:hypothetical protein